MITPLAILLIVVGTMIGQTTDTTPQIALELRELPGCEFPCWKNITPQQTSLARANRLISGAGYTNMTSPAGIADGRFLYSLPDTERCNIIVASEDAMVTRIRLNRCPPTRLGDLIRLLGEPEGLMTDRFGLLFQEGRVVVYAQRIICERRFTPHTFIGVIEIHNDAQSRYMVYPWRGFVDLQTYMTRSSIDLNC